MKQAIVTRYLPATGTKGVRIKATCDGGHSVTMPLNNALSACENHKRAMEALCKLLSWSANRVVGCYEHRCYWVEVEEGDSK